ncbi:MAG: UvrD-helicase domain-containing protein, partial [Fusobacteriaceae bacterium]
LYRFKRIEGFNSLVTALKLRDKKLASELYSLFSKFSESEITPDILYHSSVNQLQTLGILYSLYLQLLEENSFLDFSKILTQCNKILEKDKKFLDSLHNKYRYILVDEFQDTNDLQWKILLKLSGKYKNICAVGDDDQAIYRFRGASTKNILNFPNYFREDNCKVVKLQENFRSESNIIDFYSAFIKEFPWEMERYQKKIVTFKENSPPHSSVFKITSHERIELNKKILQTLLTLRETGKIEDYSQVAFLFRSVKSREARSLIDVLNSHGIKSYSPRSGEFFQKKEIIFTLGVILLLFKKYLKKIREFSKESYMNFSEKYILYSNYLKMIQYAENFSNKKDSTLKEWIHNFQEKDVKNFLPIFYELFSFQLYQELFSKSRIGDRKNELIEKNIAILANIFAKFEEDGKSILSEDFFDEYLPFLMDIGVNEYEDDEEVSIPDHVSFLTFHQSKGLEFPIVFIGSLDSSPEKSDKNSLGEKLREDIFQVDRNRFERESTMDFYRIFYTGFSRAKNLLFLTAEYRDKSFPKSPSNLFLNSLNSLQEFSQNEEFFKNISVSKLKNSDRKKRYSYTGDILLYSNCPVKYRFLKHIGFPSLHSSKEILGTLVHKTIDDIHQNIMKGTFITEDFMKLRLRENYDFLKKKLNMKLSKMEAEETKHQVFSYLLNNGETLLSLQDSELALSSLRKNY